MTKTTPYTVADAAFALLDAHRRGATRLTRKAGSFVGECIVDPTPLTEKQSTWFLGLLDKAGLPPVNLGEAR